MTYQEFIDNIIQTRGRHITEGYKETHHIKPKCLGGNDTEENLIDLTAQEHYDAHRLLALENPQVNELTYAWHMIHTTREGMVIDKDEYARLKENFTKIAGEKCRETFTGSTPWNKGTVYSHEEKSKLYDKRKANMSKSHIGKTHTEEQKLNMSRIRKEKYASGELKPAFKGQHHTEESRQKISDAGKGNTYTKGRIWITNGIISKMIYPYEQIPEGYTLGRLEVSEHTRELLSEKCGDSTRGTHWYNNGEIQVRRKECPEGFVLGKLVKEVTV